MPLTDSDRRKKESFGKNQMVVGRTRHVTCCSRRADRDSKYQSQRDTTAASTDALAVETTHQQHQATEEDKGHDESPWPTATCAVSSSSSSAAAGASVAERNKRKAADRAQTTGCQHVYVHGVKPGHDENDETTTTTVPSKIIFFLCRILLQTTTTTNHHHHNNTSDPPTTLENNQATNKPQSWKSIPLLLPSSTHHCFRPTSRFVWASSRI